MKYLQLIITAFFFLGGDSFVSAQQEENKGVIRGVVRDKSNQSVIEFATVSLFKTNDSTLVTGGITSSTGAFEIAKVPAGNFYVKVDFIGFEPKFFNDINVTNEKLELDLGEINLASFSKNMSQFEFVDEKELVETKIDKKVYNVSKDISAQGGTGLDVLKNMPSVEVDEQDKISLRGDKGVQVLIDGRPTAISASDLLKQIPSSSIEKIEVITNPSAKYNPEGMSGIINVIMKKEKASGFNGNINLGYRYNGYSGYNGSLNFNYRKNKINITSNIGTYQGVWQSKAKEDRNYINDTTYTQQMLSHNLGDNINLWYTLGLDYYINKKNTVYIQTNGWGWNGDNESIRRYNYFDASDNILSFSNRNSNSDNSYSGLGLTSGWQTQFDTEEHTLDLEVNLYRNNNTGSIENEQIFYFTNQKNQFQNTNQNGKGDQYDVKLDYELPITDSLTLEAGLRATINDENSDFFSASANSIALLKPDTNLNNVFDYQQQVYAAYAIVGKQFKKLGIKLGSRIEQTLVNTKLINTNEKNNQDYLSFFPSLHLSYKANEKNEMLLSYSRRINRPESWDVNPFSSYEDPYDLFKGNPKLKPEFIDVYELSYLRFWDKFNFNSSVYFRQVNDKHQYVTTLTNGNIYLSTQQNLSKTQITGGEITLSYNPKKWWKMNGGFNLWSSNLNGATGSFNKNTYGWSTNFSSNFILPKQWSANTQIRYSGKQRAIQGINKDNYNVSVSVSKKFLKEKARLTLRFDDIFQTQRWAFESNNLNNSYYTSESRWSSTSVNLSFSYSFGKMNYDSQKRQSKDTSAGDDLNIGTGSGGGGQGK